MPDVAAFRREHHRAIAATLADLNAPLLLRARCYFGGGTLIALSFGEFRESRDIDFLCSDRAGFRELREAVTQESLGMVARRPLQLAREVRADRDGIRTFIKHGESTLKFEILQEARLDLTGAMDANLGVPVLDFDWLVAEKILANADRGLDESTRSRDVLDLAFVAAARGHQALLPGMRMATAAYGKPADRELRAVLEKLSSRQGYLKACVTDLAIENMPTLRKGLAQLKALVQEVGKPGSREARKLGS